MLKSLPKKYWSKNRIGSYFLDECCGPPPPNPAVVQHLTEVHGRSGHAIGCSPRRTWLAPRSPVGYLPLSLPDGEHPYVENLYIAGSSTSSDHLPFYGNPVNWGNYDYLRALGLAPYNNITSPFCAIYTPDYEKAVVDFLQSIEQPAQVAFDVNNATTNANAVASWLYYFFFTGTTTGMSFYTIRSDGDHTFDMPDGTSFTVYGIYQNGTLYPSNGGVPLSSPGVNNNDAFMNRHSLLPMPMIGIGEKKTNLGNNIILFPNPSDNEVRFINISYQTTIEVYNQNGQLVEKRTNTSNGNISLQIADWPKGLYIVRIGGEKDNPTTLKLIKQ